MSEVNQVSERASAGGAAQAGAAPDREQRLALVRSYQAQALRRRDPLLANLGALTGDLLGLAHGLAELVREGMARGPAGRQRFCQDAELYLRFLRQLDRLASLERRPPPPGGGEGTGR
jgi:hypothetical protein